MDISSFEKNDWDHLHDVVLNVTCKKSTREELEVIFESLSVELKHLAYEWGMNDTVFREKAYDFLMQELSKKVREKYEENEKRNKLFAIWVVNMIKDGRIWFSTRPGFVGEPDIDEVDVVVEFAGGPESVGNDGSGSFSWRDLQGMAEEQGLLK